MSTGLHREASRIDFKTEKVRDTEWRKDPKPWTQFGDRKLSTSGESHLIYHYAKTLGGGRYADVGSFRGASAAAMGHGLQAGGHYGRVYAVDYFAETGDSAHCCPNADTPGILSTYYREQLPEVDLVICKGHTGEWARKVHGPFRFVFIDADHSYEGCKADTEAWSVHIPVGGVMAFHDTDFDSVDQVIRELPSCWKLERHVFTTKAFRRV